MNEPAVSSVYNAQLRTPSARRFKRYYPTDANFGAGFSIRESQAVADGLYNETTFGAAAVNVLTRDVIGTGLRLEPSPEEIGPVTQKRRVQWISTMSALWRLWADSRDADYYGKDTFNSLQQQAYREIKVHGDVLVHLVLVKGNNGLPALKVQLISGRMVANDGGQMMDTKQETAGVLLDAQGRETGFRVRETDDNRIDTFHGKVCQKFDSTGRQVYALVHIGDPYPNMVRGVSVFNAIKDHVLNTIRFDDAYAGKAIAQSIFAVGFKHSQEVSRTALENIAEASGSGEGEEEEQLDLSQTGATFDMAPGEEAQVIENNTPGASYKDYMEERNKLSAMAVGIPIERLTSSYNANYSASRAAIQDAERYNRMDREEFATKFCQFVYEAFCDICVADGYVKAPGYFDDPLYRKAYRQATWTGPVATDIDPVKEVKAKVIAINNRLTTRERAAKDLYGMDFTEVIGKQAQEESVALAHGVSLPETDVTGTQDSTDENDEGEE